MDHPPAIVQGDATGPRLRVAFVTQRYGSEVNGGAEALCRHIAERMARHWEIDILTTCALDYVTWKNHFPEGETFVDGVTVRRFPVSETRDIEHFNRLSHAICANPSPSTAMKDEWMRAQGPWSPALLEAIALGHSRYDVFFFFGYLYAPTFFGLPTVADKAILVPLAHDEWTLQLPIWDAIFHGAAGFVFNTPEERGFLRGRFPEIRFEGPVAGLAVTRPPGIDPGRFRAQYGIGDPFLLYVGRIDPSKGCDELFAHFLRHVERTGDVRPLVMLGRAVMPIPDHPQVRALGFVSDEDKWDALAACDMLVMPSHYESLSIVLLEAWAVSKPVVVNGECDVLVGQARRANGGLAYFSDEEFSAGVMALSCGSAASVLGRQGHDYVRATYSWRGVEAAYLEIAAHLRSDTRTRAAPSQSQAAG